MASLKSLSNHRRREQMSISLFSCVLSGILFILFFTDCINSQMTNCASCEQGSCNKADTDRSIKCICFPGWEGELCNKCRGKISTIEGTEGVIFDGTGNYSQESTCSWLLKSNKTNARVQLIFNEFATECIWDHLYIHDGDSTSSPLIAAFSGVFWGLKYKPRLKFLLSGQYAFIHFYSDAAFTLPGFNISFFIDDCALECSEHADCINGTCKCKPDWTGINCDSLITQVCLDNCSVNGVCINSTCVCKPGFSGKSCEVSRGLSVLQEMSVKPTELAGRASLSFVFDNVDSLYLSGGYKMKDYNATNNLFVYNFTSQHWYHLNDSEQSVWPRYGHSSVYYNNSLYILGGTYKHDIVNDLWRYDIDTGSWTALNPGPRNVTGHSAHVYKDTMIVIFGYSSNYGYLNDVAQYNFTTNQWKIIKTSGSIVQGTYAHTSVLDVKTGMIYVYGGYQAHITKGCSLTDKLYRYNPDTQEWFKLQGSGTARYLHSAAIINGVMVTFGGSFGSNTVNDTLLKCFVSDFMIYDIDCDKWYTAFSNFQTLDRFGHSMLAVNNTAYLFGGFNSVLLNDLYNINLDNCDVFLNETQCQSTRHGLKCKWDGNSCVKHTSCSTSDGNSSCIGYTNCNACSANTNCQWCGNQCLASSFKCTPGAANNCASDTDAYERCSSYFNCKACQENDKCVWQGSNCANGTGAKINETRSCSQKPCNEHTSCQNCTSGYCMWCSNLDKCIETNAYVVTYHYAQCMDWTTKFNECQAMSCSQQKTCAECQAKPECGWCNDETETGTGKCMDGGFTGPSNSSLCPVDRWSFLQCPPCQCNGHSKCINGSICIQCENHTTGAQCDECSNGYYGDAKNGGQCFPCSCNGQADTCNPSTGDCYCRTRGVTGKFCEKCDDSNKYSGNPKDGGTCYYPLNTDFQYTFNLSKKEDSNFTQINFLNIPLSTDRDVDFSLNCSQGAYVNITYKSKSFPEEKEYVSMRPCEPFRTKFEHKNHVFGGKENTTFLVYVFNFRTPFMLQISFVQPEKINLLRFFIIFFSCFLSLLLIAAALWKIKHKYDSYRRRQQLIVEMQQMASRPFSTIAVDIDRKSNQSVLVDKKDHLDSVLRRRKKTINKPSALAIEPLSDHKAAILTLFIQLPTGDSDFAPCGQSGLAVGSALVSISSHRKQSLEHAKGDKPKIRKNTYSHPDTCA